MNKLDEIRLKILDAKEKRWIKQKEAILNFEKNLISFKFNIPSWPKNSDLIDSAFSKIVDEYFRFLNEYDVDYTVLSSDIFSLGPEKTILSKTNAKKLKDLSIKFEESNSIGRLLDIDIINTNFKSIDREVKRQCYFCNEIALICIREQTHTPEDLRVYFNNKLEEYLKT